VSIFLNTIFLLLVELRNGFTRMVAEHFLPVSFPSGTVIIQQGASGDDFFIVKDGTVKVTQDAGGKVTEVAELKSGDYFGEMALLNSDTRKANVVADTEVQCFSLNRSAFSELLGPLQV
jgi:CRP-like cAMP-binding protein